MKNFSLVLFFFPYTKHLYYDSDMIPLFFFENGVMVYAASKKIKIRYIYVCQMTSLIRLRNRNSQNKKKIKKKTLGYYLNIKNVN
ncbi:hypothetical protein PUN28_013848 [Cardiocondyla obscurior]|uniref:Uncharacterized protein n=1 Tax=Cardiocondyla obscurior TaxID=286306 RepID=A0AAW2F3D5_9HYME